MTGLETLGERFQDYNQLLTDLPVLSDLVPYAATTVVIDTNILLSELYWMLRNKKDVTTLLILVRTQRVNLFFPEENVDEIEEHIPDIARSLSVSASEVSALWERTYAPLLRIVPDLKPHLTISQENTLELRDADDIPLLRLATILNAQWFLSQDKDLIMVGAESQYVDVSIDLRQYHAGETVTYALRVGSQLFTLTGIGLVTALFKGILAVWGIARKSPTWLKLAVVCFLILGLSSKKGRSWILNAVELIPRELGEARDILSGAFESVFDYWESGQAMKRRSETSLAKYGSWQSSLHPEKAEDFVILVLAASSTALAVGTIARRVIALGYVTRNQRFEYYILRILRSNPAFTGTPDGRWTLGASLAPKPTVQVAGE